MLLSNLSDGSCETKDVIIENEAVIRKLAELLVCIVWLYDSTSSFILSYTAASKHQYSDTLCMCLCCETSY